MSVAELGHIRGGSTSEPQQTTYKDPNERVELSVLGVKERKAEIPETNQSLSFTPISSPTSRDGMNYERFASRNMETNFPAFSCDASVTR
jgi:hypothetical protein